LLHKDSGKILLSAVEEGFSSLDELSKQAIFFHLEASFQVKKENIPKNLPEFKDALEGLFGPGAPYIEKTITRRLHERLGLGLENDSCTDSLRCINVARKRIASGREWVTT
jgi:hypothetical protein